MDNIPSPNSTNPPFIGVASPPRSTASSTNMGTSPARSLEETCFQIATDIDEIPEPDYGLLTRLTEERESFEQEQQQEIMGDSYSNIQLDDEEISMVASSPDYDYLGFDEDEAVEVVDSAPVKGAAAAANVPDVPTEKEYDYVMLGEGEEYILGTLMVRVLQARNVKFHHQNDLSSLLTNHRRSRHKKYSQSPLSGGAGNLTPNSTSTLYSQLVFNSHQQYTENAVPGINGDYYWSRGDQSYFDVVCRSFTRANGGGYQFGGKKKADAVKKQDGEEKKQDDDVCCKSNQGVDKDMQKHPCPEPKVDTTSLAAPVLKLALFAKKSGKGGKQMGSPPTLKKKGFDDNYQDGEGEFVGECSINITRVLTGKTSYFDEWCTLHNDNFVGLEDHADGVGKVRVVIEYEPTDSPPRSGDVCILANIYPGMEKELYPVTLWSVRTNRPVFRSGSITSFDKSASASSTTLSSNTSSLSSASNNLLKLTREHKQFHVEECIGDHVVLSYTTIPENWKVTFEIHRYNLLVTHRYVGTVEKVREGLLDFCDNISQSPMVDVLSKTVETLPEEGLFHVGAEAVGASVAVLGRWMEIGFGGALEDVVDAANLDGRYSHLSDDEEEDEVVEEEEEQQRGDEVQDVSPLKSEVAKTDLEEPPEEKEALPGMPCCPITGQPMIDPVVAADGHTYERYAIARWFQTSNKSPLTGAVMPHANLVPNYLLLSSLSGDAAKN